MLKRLLKIKDSAEFKNIFSLFSATIFTQVIGLIATPFLTRFFLPASFGLFTSFNSIVALLTQISNGRFALSIVVPKEDEEAHALWLFSRKITLVLSLLVLSVCLVLMLFFFRQNSIVWVIFLPLMFILVGLNEATNYYLTRLKAFKTMANGMMLLSFSNFTIAIILGFSGLVQQFGLIISIVLGQVAANIYYLTQINARLKTVSFNLSAYSPLFLLKKYKSYPIYGLPSAVVGTLAQQIFVYYLTLSHDADTTGFYGLSLRIVQVPMALITASINNVILNKMSTEVHNNRSVEPIIRNTSRNIALLCIPIIVVTYLLAPWGFKFIFGEKWAMSGVFAQYLIIIYSIRITVSPISTIFIVKNRLNIDLKWQITYLLTMSFFLACSNQWGLPFLSVIQYAIFIELILYIYYFSLALKESKV